ncbi:Polyprenol reductase, partial [Trichinella pseudospiralis]
LHHNSMLISWIEAFWLVCTAVILFPGLIIIKFPKFSTLLNNCFKYGKSLSVGCHSNWELIQVPKRWFTHFYIVAVITTSYALFNVFHCYIANGLISKSLQEMLILLRKPVWSGNNFHIDEISPRLNEQTVLLCSILLWFHAIRRFYESAFISVYSDSKMNCWHYLLGLIYYILMPFSILVEAPKFRPNDRYVAMQSYAFMTSVQMFGLFLFLWSSYMQHQCFLILAAARRNSLGNIVSHEHRIIHGGWFDLVSCPHFLFEILIYLSVWFCQRMIWNVWCCVLIFVYTNQIIAAKITHDWYRQKYSQYPKHRTALIPTLI